MRYIDDFNMINEKLGNELIYLNEIVGKNALKDVPQKFSGEKITKAQQYLRKRVQMLIRSGLIRKSETPMYYEVNDETLATPIYANCLASEVRTKKRQLDKIMELIHKHVTLDEIKNEKRCVLQIGVECQDFVLSCQLSALIRKAFQDKELMDEVQSLFQVFFRNVYKDFQFTYDLEFIKYIDCMKYSENCAINERVAFLFFAHRLAKEMSVYAWTIILPIVAMLMPPKEKDSRFSINADIFDAFNEFTVNTGVLPTEYMTSHQLDNKINQIAKDFKVSDDEKEVFVHACYYIASLEQDFMKQLDYDLDHCMTPEEIVEPVKNNELEVENKKLQEQLLSLQGKCENLQDTINTLVVEKQIAINKQQKEMEQLEKKYEECMEELALYNELEQEEEIQMDQAPQLDLKDKKIVIIGGHDRWHQLIKTLYPNWILINDEKPLDFNMFRVDGIFFFTKYMSHRLYRKYINQCRCHDIPFSYLTSLNIKSVEEQIRETLQVTEGEC